MQHDMPAKDAARWGGPAGWRLQQDMPILGLVVATGIEGFVNGVRRQCAVREPIETAMPVLTEWARKPLWGR